MKISHCLEGVGDLAWAGGFLKTTRAALRIISFAFASFRSSKNQISQPQYHEIACAIPCNLAVSNLSLQNTFSEELSQNPLSWSWADSDLT